MTDHEAIAIEDEQKRVSVWAFKTLRALDALGLSDGPWVPEETWDRLRRIAGGDASAEDIELAIDAMEAAEEYREPRDDDWPTPEQIRDAADKPREV